MIENALILFFFDLIVIVALNMVLFFFFKYRKLFANNLLCRYIFFFLVNLSLFLVLLFYANPSLYENKISSILRESGKIKSVQITYDYLMSDQEKNPTTKIHNSNLIENALKKIEKLYLYPFHINSDYKMMIVAPILRLNILFINDTMIEIYIDHSKIITIHFRGNTYTYKYMGDNLHRFYSNVVDNSSS